MNNKIKYLGECSLLSGKGQGTIVCIPVGYVVKDTLLPMDAEVYMASLACLHASENAPLQVAPPIYIYLNISKNLVCILLEKVFQFYQNLGFNSFFYRIKVVDKSLTEAFQGSLLYEEKLEKYGNPRIIAISLMYDLRSHIYARNYDIEEIITRSDVIGRRRKIWAKIVSNLKIFVEKMQK